VRVIENKFYTTAAGGGRCVEKHSYIMEFIFHPATAFGGRWVEKHFYIMEFIFHPATAFGGRWVEKHFYIMEFIFHTTPAFGGRCAEKMEKGPTEVNLDDWTGRIATAENMEDVDDFIPLIPGVLAFGGPLRRKMCESLSILAMKKHVPVCMIDLTNSTTSAPWYVAELPKDDLLEICRQFKLEGQREDDDELDPVKVMEAARYVKMQCQDGKRQVYVFGRECNRVACVVALVAWALCKNERKRDPIDFLHQDVLRNVSWITRDFPSSVSPAYAALIRELVKKHCQSVEAAFPGLTMVKRQKVKE
jgi:hypothetical protein